MPSLALRVSEDLSVTDLPADIHSLLGPADFAPGSPNLAIKPALSKLAVKLPAAAKARDFALACVAGLWLYHDFLDESHAVSQELETLDGSYWHALMHRRELDYSNSKYWFQRCQRHPIFDDLRKTAATMAKQAGTPTGCEFLTRQTAWDPVAFVDLCEVSRQEGLCREIARAEWELLFRYCYERAF
jgi:hypothetical protein